MNKPSEQHSDDAIFVTVRDVRKEFKLERRTIPVLRGVSLDVRRASWTVLLGASGSGKTTLLDIVGTISRPDAGTVRIGDVHIHELSGAALVSFRRNNIGFVFQAYHMLPELNILENVMLPALLGGARKNVCKARAEDLLTAVGLAHRVRHRPNELSGGEQQRAAIARSLINDPRLLLADEPTGNLDSATGAEILDLFQALCRDRGTTLIMVTHDRSVADLADDVIELRDGVTSALD